MEIRLPKTSKDLRIKHFKALRSLESELPRTMIELIEFIALFSGEPVSKIKAVVTKDDLIRMYTHIVSIFEDFKVMNPPKEITLKGRVFELVDPEKVGVGWHIDYEKANITEDPIRVACLFYFPKGEIYGAVDENKNLINPIKDRYNLIENELPLITFLECNAFFLRRFHKSMMLSTQRKKVSLKTSEIITRVQSYLSGKKSLTESPKSTSTEIGSK